MKKKLLMSLIMLSGIVFASPHEWHKGDKYGYYWCGQNWQVCKSYEEQKLMIKERELAKERECLQKAKDYWSYQECKAQVKFQSKMEKHRLRQKFLEEAK